MRGAMTAGGEGRMEGFTFDSVGVRFMHAAMSSAPRFQLVPLTRRKQLVAGIPGFSAMPANLLEEIANSLHEEKFPAGMPIVREGELGDRLFLIEDGQADVSTPGPTGPVQLATLACGDMFGEIALLSAMRRRQATVIASTPLLTLSLSASAFEKALRACPEARLDIAALADTLLSAKFLKQQGSWRR